MYDFRICNFAIFVADALIYVSISDKRLGAVELEYR